MWAVHGVPLTSLLPFLPFLAAWATFRRDEMSLSNQQSVGQCILAF